MAMQLNPPPAPRLPDPEMEYRQGYFSQLLNVFRLYFNRLSGILSVLLGPDGGAELQSPHAMLMSDQDQASGGVTVANPLKFDTPVILDGIEVKGVNNDEVHFSKAGQYLVSFSLQVTNRDNQDHLFEVWAGFNGQNYPLSNTRFDVPQRKNTTDWGHAVPSITGIFTVTDPDNDYLTIKWWSDSTLVFLEHYPAQTSPDRPEIPSIIMTINFVSRLP
jgi:hypothetical protein